MPWLKLLHISAVIVWCGALLYMPSAIAASIHAQAASDASGSAAVRRLPRLVFTGLATPAALIAIGSGTAIFWSQGPLAAWLVAKLAVVGLLVLGHGICGVLILRSERQRTGQTLAATVAACWAVAATSVLWLGLIAWLVLAKPF